jgi:putative molybdopterin biosynthesis protein
MALVRSDGVVKVPAAVEGVSRWADVTVLLSERDVDVEGTILAIGSHDVSLDLLSTRIREEDPSLSLASANVGSMGGIIAIKEGQAHIAGTHLLDPETGDFNVPYILERLSPDEVLLVHLGWREQGLMVAPGNPAGVEGAADLARKDVRFVNRQKGSGTRLLLDYELGRLGVDPGEVTGYEREMFTHTAVAAAVKRDQGLRGAHFGLEGPALPRAGRSAGRIRPVRVGKDNRLEVKAEKTQVKGSDPKTCIKVRR